MKNYILFLLILVISGCSLSNNPGLITYSESGEAVYFDVPLTIYQEQAGTGKSTAGRNGVPVSGFAYDAVFVTRLPAPEIAGAEVHGNDILISGNQAFIAYNTAGDTFSGAVQILNISNKKKTAVTGEIKFQGADINAIFIQGNTLFFGGAADPDVYGFTPGKNSIIGKIDLTSINIENITASITSLPGYGVTGITMHNGRVYAAVGAENGGVQILSAELVPESFYGIDDPRDIERYQSGVITITGTADSSDEHGAITIFPNADLTNPAVIPVREFNGSHYHKATIEVWEGTKALLGISEAGFQIRDLADGSGNLLADFPNPVPDDPELQTFTNSASSDGDLIFTANGEYGFRVYKPDRLLTEASLIGFHDFSEENLDVTASANHVEYKSGLLFCAAGSAGVLIYSFEKL
jgi:hypothetical protein